MSIRHLLGLSKGILHRLDVDRASKINYLPKGIIDMSSINRASRVYTHGGSVAKEISPELMLRRSVLSCLLWEKEFYEDGQTIAQRIDTVASACTPVVVYQLAMEARHIHGLRHVPLLLLLNLIKREEKVIKHGNPEDNVRVKQAVANVIRRPDEMTELLALYWSGKQKVGNKIPVKLSDRQLRDGLALAFKKFDEYSLAKYNRDGVVRLRDVLILSHPKPKNDAQSALFKRLLEGEMKTPGTWEVLISACGSDKEKKKAAWERLLKNTLSEKEGRDDRLGYMAVLRNLRNMVDCGCDIDLIREVILARKNAELVFPFRYLAAARIVPRLEPEIDRALSASIQMSKPLSGKTIVMVDVSGSMAAGLSGKSDLSRKDAAACLASVIPSNDLRVFSFANRLMELPPRKGMAGVQSIVSSQNGGTNLSGAVSQINKEKHDRLIIVTDEQDTTGKPVPHPVCRRPYMINVASNRNGVGYGPWIHLDGFSEGIIRYIQMIEEFDESVK